MSSAASTAIAPNAPSAIDWGAMARSAEASQTALILITVEPGSDCYLGRLCSYSSCPKGKSDCFVPGCGAVPFNKRIANFAPHADLLAPVAYATLYRRDAGRLRSALALPTVDQDEARSG